uniref:Putative secreted protein n=1 Tax=Ixodes scapularis TaxID=6945 RepID=A0A4D5RC58_IXOSC
MPVLALLSTFTALSKSQPDFFTALWRRGAHNKHALQNTVVFLYVDVPELFSLFLRIREAIFSLSPLVHYVACRVQSY